MPAENTTPVAGIITLVATSNPKAKGSRSAARFALYKTGMSVSAYKEACVKLKQPHAKRNATADLEWDLDRGYIAISGRAPKHPKQAPATEA